MDSVVVPGRAAQPLPHQLSGGGRFLPRSRRPVIIVDEPTTGQDALTQVGVCSTGCAWPSPCW
ncbi:hypothetical protein [Actinokineospora sp. NBRC 105648]|uniref:hypothetical protein n=1 Tax=Actinokineospora sp. NBRC 105648 TaxID=3032206 RepID=UPI0025561BAD|nr:hypothetical protein [Actinokineospora sp. NBRC 105648]